MVWGGPEEHAVGGWTPLVPVMPSGSQEITWCTDLAALLAEEGGGGRLGDSLGSYVLLRSGVCHWNIGQAGSM